MSNADAGHKPQEMTITMSRAILFAGLLLFASPAIGQAPHDQMSAAIDSAELIVRPGLAEFRLKVGRLWECLSRSPTDAAKIVARDEISGGQAVRIQFTSGRWMDLAFRRTGDAALLLAAKGSDGSIARTPDELSALVRTLAAGCENQR
jgi:hypothetical protein